MSRHASTYRSASREAMKAAIRKPDGTRMTDAGGKRVRFREWMAQFKGAAVENKAVARRQGRVGAS